MPKKTVEETPKKDADAGSVELKEADLKEAQGGRANWKVTRTKTTPPL